MEITLRQAHKLVEKINGQIHNIGLTPTAELNIWEVVSAQADLDLAKKQFDTKFNRVETLMLIRMSLRELIRNANERVGINTLIAERKSILDGLGFLHSLLVLSARGTAINSGKALEKKLDHLRAAGSDRSAYGAQEQITVSFIGETERFEFEEDQATLIKRRDAIEDNLLTLNVGTRIKLTKEEVVTLQKERLL